MTREDKLVHTHATNCDMSQEIIKERHSERKEYGTRGVVGRQKEGLPDEGGNENGDEPNSHVHPSFNEHHLN